jgi:MATE family multidrug resistance protein
MNKVCGYLSALAFSLSAAMLFTVYCGFNTAVSRPKAVMVIQITGLMLKIPLSALFIYGWTLPKGTATLVAQRVGANDLAEARRLGWHGVEIGVGIAAVLGAWVYFAREPVLHIQRGWFAPAWPCALFWPGYTGRKRGTSRNAA